MKRMIDTAVIGLLVMGVTLGITGVSMGSKSPLDAFPQAKEGEVRHVIVLEEKGQEEMNYKVELIPGKVVQTDGVNRVRLGLGLEPENLKGWGYTYYRVTGKDHVLSTMMAAPEGSEMSDSFVYGNSLLVRYNSRLPLVIYGPEGVDIRYKVWSAGKEMKSVVGE